MIVQQTNMESEANLLRCAVSARRRPLRPYRRVKGDDLLLNGGPGEADQLDTSKYLAPAALS
jgi:hypothetical protein